MEDNLVENAAVNEEDKKRRRRILFIVIAILIICCCCVGFVYSGWTWWGDLLYDYLMEIQY